jgi:hypothetical protein
MKKGQRKAQAIELVEQHGFQVFPCEPDGKAPATSNGCKDASDDKDVVASWFTSLPDSNIGIATGEPSGFIAIDIDPGTDRDAFLNACELIGMSDLGEPGTLTVDTPSGGQHWYFKWPGFAVRNQVNIVPGVDIRGDGGYVIGPGSSIGKKHYGLGLDSEIAELPAALKKRLMNGKAKAAESSETWAALQGIAVSEGGRNQALTQFAGALWNSGIAEDELLAALMERNGKYQPPLPDDEVKAVAKSAARNFTRSQSTGSGQAFVGIDFNELLRLPLPAVDFLLTPVIARGGLSLVHAAPGIGKTTLSIGIACAVATGSGFLEWRGGDPGRVLFIDGEMTANVMKERFSLAAGERSISDGQLVIATPDLVLAQCSTMPDLGTGEGQLLVNQGIPEDTRLIVVDNISSLVRTGDENAAEFWVNVQPWALSHRAAGRSVLFVHHDNKGAQSYRGTSKLADVMDTVLHLVRPDDYEPEQGCRFVVRTTKSRLATALPDFEAWLQPDGWQVTVCKSKAELAVEMSGLGMKNKDIAEELDVHASTVGRWLSTRKFEDAIP